LIQEDFATVDTTTDQYLSLNATGKANLASWLSSNASAGEYIIVRLQSDLTPTNIGTYSRYQFYSETGDFAPEMTVTGSQAMLASGGVAQADPVLATSADIDSLLPAATTRWAMAGSMFGGATFQVADLGTGVLGSYAGGVITIDDDAAGYGWYVDTTPMDDSEFFGTGPAGMDLLTVLMHEMGHAMNLSHADTGVMQDSLATGTRLAPTVSAADVDEILGDDGDNPLAELMSMMNVL
jgi:hypothetical protein